jgi:periplasmic divalent cation tolerance protein
MNQNQSQVLIILTSVDKQESAQDLAKGLVDKKLAACVQISAAGTSVYAWKDELCTDEEFYLSIKTDEMHRDAVILWLEAHHPYDTPEIITLNAKASSEYHNWLSNALS